MLATHSRPLATLIALAALLALVAPALADAPQQNKQQPKQKPSAKPDPADKPAQHRVFIEEDGYICIEAEATDSELGEWTKHTDASAHKWIDGFLGEACLQFTGNKETSGPPRSVLTYRIRITNPGKYQLAVRGLEAPIETGEGDKANDCYVRMVGQDGWEGQFTKCVLLGKSYEWSWNVRSEYKHHTFTFATYDLAAGMHTFEVAGRSRNFFIDRIVIHKDLKQAEARSDKLAPSRHISIEAPADSAKPTNGDGNGEGPEKSAKPRFNPKADLISLHYDHAPDRDDGHSAAADRTLLTALHDAEWIKSHTLAVSGAYGLNRRHFREDSDAVMDAAWNDLGGWVAAHKQWDKAVAKVFERWATTLKAGGDVWVKEGGQSDITADVVRMIKQKMPDIDTTRRIHVVQHSNWNEKQTTKEALAYVKRETHYLRIRDANAYLNRKGGDEAFVKTATAHPTAGPAWRAAFHYYNPNHRLDFSDTGELLHILGLGELDIDAFEARFLNRQNEEEKDRKKEEEKEKASDKSRKN